MTTHVYQLTHHSMDKNGNIGVAATHLFHSSLDIKGVTGINEGELFKAICIDDKFSPEGGEFLNIEEEFPIDLDAAVGIKPYFWEEYPDFPSEDWRSEVAADDTRLGYADWVEHQKIVAADEEEEESRQSM